MFLTRSFALCRTKHSHSTVSYIRDKHKTQTKCQINRERDVVSYFEKLSSYNDDRSSAVSDFSILKLGEFNQNLKKPH